MEKKSLTQELEIVNIELSFDDKAKTRLSPDDYVKLTTYIKNNGPELSLITANRFFELYLHGNSFSEIVELNPSFQKEPILWASIRYDWDKAREEYVKGIQTVIMQKVLKAELEVASLYSDMLSVTAKKNGGKLKKYLQTGNEKELDGALLPESILALGKVVEGLQKITGRDRNVRITKDENVNISVTASNNEPGTNSLSAEGAAEVLRIVADEKRKKERTILIKGDKKNEESSNPESKSSSK